MAKLSKRLLVIVIMAVLNLGAFAQESTGGNTLNDTMRSHNKIYVVMAVCLTILTGILLYLVRIDRKIGKHERGAL